MTALAAELGLEPILDAFALLRVLVLLLALLVVRGGAGTPSTPELAAAASPA